MRADRVERKRGTDLGFRQCPGEVLFVRENEERGAGKPLREIGYASMKASGWTGRH